MKLEISASQLSFGMHGEDVAGVQQALLKLGRDVPIAERSRAAFGPGTLAVVKTLRHSPIAVAAEGFVQTTSQGPKDDESQGKLSPYPAGSYEISYIPQWNIRARFDLCV